MTWPCLQRRGSLWEGPVPVNRTVGAGAHVSCSLLVTTTAQQTEGYEKQVNSRTIQFMSVTCWTIFFLRGHNLIVWNPSCDHQHVWNILQINWIIRAVVFQRNTQSTSYIMNSSANLYPSNRHPDNRGGGKAILVSSGKVTCGCRCATQLLLFSFFLRNNCPCSWLRTVAFITIYSGFLVAWKHLNKFQSLWLFFFFGCCQVHCPNIGSK